MEALTPEVIRKAWQKESALLYPRPEPSSVAARTIAGVEEFLASNPDDALQGMRALLGNFPDLIELLGCKWCLDASAYSNAVEVEYQARLLGMAAAQTILARHAGDPDVAPALPKPVNAARFKDELTKKLGSLVVRVPGTLRPDLMSPRVLGQDRIGFIVVPVYYHQACEDFAQQLRDAGRRHQRYAADALGTMMASITATPAAPSTRVGAELLVSTIASVAGNVDRLPADALGAAARRFDALFGEPEERDPLVTLLSTTLTDFAIAHEAAHWWAQHQPKDEASHAAAQESTAHIGALSMLVAYHHFLGDTGLVEAMVSAGIGPVVAPLMIQVLHVSFLRYLFKLTAHVMHSLGAPTRDESIAARMKRLAEAHRKDLLHFQLMLEDLRQLVYADSASFTDEVRARVDVDVARIVAFQRAMFQHLDQRSSVLGQVTDAQLIEIYGSLSAAMARQA